MSIHTLETEQDAHIGPGSILWENLGRRYNLLVAASAGILQNMLPALGAGVEDYSEVFKDPGKRLAVSSERILEVVYGPEPEKTGIEIRDIHKGMGGRDRQGRPYHALQPTTFWWAHATFEEATAQAKVRFSGELFTRENRRQLNSESMTWFARYGVTSRAIPPTLEAFEEEYERVCEEELEMTPVAEYLIGLFQEGDIESFIKAFNVNPAAWKVGRKAISDSVRVFTIGGLPETVRERFDIRFSKADKIKLEAQDAAVRRIVPLLSQKQLYLPIALEGIEREKAKVKPEAVVT
ncbi:MAG: oxygenase MpaB family protein [Candidatus Saccharimonadales bacterium]